MNTVKGKRERVGRMLHDALELPRRHRGSLAGDIVALAGLKETTTGDTLCDPLKPVILERMEFPEPVIEIAVEPKTKGDQEKMGLALNRLAAEDPSFRVKTDEESGQTIIEGHGRTAPRHPRRPHEARVQGRGQHRCAAGCLPRDDHQARPNRLHPQEAVGWFGSVRRVKIRFEPNEPGEASSSKQDRRWFGAEGIHPGRREGHRQSVMDSGPLAGFPMLDIKATLIDGRYHDVDSSSRLRNRGARCFREGSRRHGSKLLEPIMKVEVVTPEDYVGDVIGDLNSRRGQIQGQEMRGNAVVITAFVPLANMFGYVNTLRSMSAVRSTRCSFDHYEPVPRTSPRRSRRNTPKAPGPGRR
jgi:elongation factor G